MKHLTFFSACFFMIWMMSCKSQDVAGKGPQPTKDSTVYKGVTDESCAVEMAYGSYGSGIDGDAFEKMIKLIDDKKLKYTAKPIGREGETRVCFPLTELKAKEKNDIINQLKKIAKEGQLVSVSIR